MTSTALFEGFPPDAINFLHELIANNDKEWFAANKKRYINTIQQPGLALVTAIGERLQDHYPDVVYDTRTNGSGTMMRIHRDVRFSPDKSPYKTEIGFLFSDGQGKRMSRPAFGLRLTTEGVDTIAGQFQFADKDNLAAWRDAVISERFGPALEAAAEQVRAAGPYTIQGESYKRVPRGYAADHPRASWLKYGGLYASAPQISLDIVQSPALTDALMTHFLNMAPVQRWLMEALG